MKIRVKIRDLVEMLVFQNYEAFAEKYQISQENVKLLIEALHNKNWRVV